MNIKPHKMNGATEIVALLVVYLILALVTIDTNGNYGFTNPMVIFIAIIAGIIAFATAGLGCCKAEGNENETRKKKGAK